MSRDKKHPLEILSDQDHSLVQHAIKNGWSRRDILKQLGYTGLLMAGVGGGALGDMSNAWGTENSTPKRGGHIRVAAHSTSTQDTLDPALGSTTIDYIRAYSFYNGLTEFDEKMTPQPSLAESFETTDNGNHWVFTLRKGVSFHNGKSLTPQDVIYSITRHKDPKTGSKAMSMVSQIDSIKALDGNRVEINLSSPNVELPSILAAVHLCIVPDGTQDFSKGIGTGPFKCQEFQPGIHSVGVRNEHYWKEGKPYLDSIEIVGIGDESARVNALLSGDVQLINNLSGTNADRVKQASGRGIKVVNAGDYTDLVMRVDREPTKRPEFREALKYLFNRQQILDVALRGYGEIANDHPIPSNNPYYFSGLPQRQFDPEKAASLIKKAGLTGAKVPLVVSPAAIYSVEMGQFLQQSAAQAGLNLVLNRVPSDGYWSNHWIKDTLGFGNILPRPTPNITLSQFFLSSAPWNESGWKNDQFDQLVISSRSEPNMDKRKQMYADMQTLIHEQGGIGIPLFLSDIDGYDSRVGGYEKVIPQGGFMGFMFAENVWWNG